jgi:hypothetical protein
MTAAYIRSLPLNLPVKHDPHCRRIGSLKMCTQYKPDLENTTSSILGGKVVGQEHSLLGGTCLSLDLTFEASMR